jgi:hypothetical protein
MLSFCRHVHKPISNVIVVVVRVTKPSELKDVYSKKFKSYALYILAKSKGFKRVNLGNTLPIKYEYSYVTRLQDGIKGHLESTLLCADSE